VLVRSSCVIGLRSRAGKPSNGSSQTGAQAPIILRRAEFLALDLPDFSGGWVYMQAVRGGNESAPSYREEQIVCYIVGGLSDKDKVGVARDVTLALLPRRIDKFIRTRWLTSNAPVLQCCLVANSHNLLARTVCRWIDLQAGRRLTPAAPVDAAWVPSDSEPEEKVEDRTAAPGHTSTGGPSMTSQTI
jgi:hypothetical protein